MEQHMISKSAYPMQSMAPNNQFRGNGSMARPPMLYNPYVNNANMGPNMHTTGNGMNSYTNGMNNSNNGMNHSNNGMNNSLNGMNSSLNGMNNSLNGMNNSFNGNKNVMHNNTANPYHKNYSTIIEPIPSCSGTQYRSINNSSVSMQKSSTMQQAAYMQQSPYVQQQGGVQRPINYYFPQTKPMSQQFDSNLANQQATNNGQFPQNNVRNMNNVQVTSTTQFSSTQSSAVGQRMQPKSTQQTQGAVGNKVGGWNDSKNKGVKIGVLTGTAERVIKWSKVYTDYCLYEVIASIIGLEEGTISQQKVMLIKDHRGPILQVIYYTVDDVNIGNVYIGQMLRCVGHMVGPARLRAFSIRGAKPDEIASLQRLCYICDHSVSRSIQSSK